MLAELRPKKHQRYRSLPILGPIIDEFIGWAHGRGYSRNSLIFQLSHLRDFILFLQRCGLKSWKELTPVHFDAAWKQLSARKPNVGGTIRQVQLFLKLIYGFAPSPEEPVTRVEGEARRYGEYLRKVCGNAESTIILCEKTSIGFLEFIDYERNTSALGQLTLHQIEAYVIQQSKRCKRSTLQGVVSRLRNFLRFQYAEGVIPRSFHDSIDMPRVYRLEQLPRALPWTQVQALLDSIDRSEPSGLRDYTLLFLIAAYGLRRSEVVALTLDDIDWRNRTLRVRQRKTQQQLVLPLTDEAGDILQFYLRKDHRSKERRTLFSRLRAPVGPLAPSAVNTILKRRIRRSGLKLEPVGPHCLRHSLATRLLHQGVSMKVIGDTLGHRSIASTDIYLRLMIGDLRGVGLEVPQAVAPSSLSAPGWENLIPRIRKQIDLDHPRSTCFHSRWAAALQRYVETKQALGRRYSNETRVLLDWDDFLYRQQNGLDDWSEDSFSRWTHTLEHYNPRVRRHWMQIVRNSMLFYARDHTVGFIPDPTAFPKPSAPRPAFWRRRPD